MFGVSGTTHTVIQRDLLAALPLLLCIMLLGGFVPSDGFLFSVHKCGELHPHDVAECLCTAGGLLSYLRTAHWQCTVIVIALLNQL